MKFFRLLVRSIYWFQAFAAPAIIFGVAALFFSSPWNIIILVAGCISGIILAEYIRKKFGLEIFFARIYGPNEMDEKL